MNPVAFENIDQYIAQFPEETQALLEQLRAVIRETAPLAVECISYQMPAFKMKRVLVYFAGYKGHIGFYPSGTGIAAFQHEFKDFKWSKGAVQFPLDKPLPLELVRRIVLHRIMEDEALVLKKPKRKN
ncbi:MAG: DUF1801 domain-containing protein [Bacteroidetes bacterium]|nr:DUF1801 domain-containing protein [Bacteroidota bacterium]